jgi:transposase InsO family protein
MYILSIYSMTCVRQALFPYEPRARKRKTSGRERGAVVIETWRREYKDERPKKGLGGLTPAAYARQLTAKTKMAKVAAGL